MTAQRSILVIIAATHRDAPIGAPSVICQAATAPASDEAVPPRPPLPARRSCCVCTGDKLQPLKQGLPGLRDAPAIMRRLEFPGCSSYGRMHHAASLPGRSPLTGGTFFRGSRWSNAGQGPPPPAWLRVAWRGCKAGCARKSRTCTALQSNALAPGAWQVTDISLEDYVAVKPKFAVYVPHTAGRYQKKRFRKAQCPIVERCGAILRN